MGTSKGCKHNAWQGFTYPCIDCDDTPDDPILRSIGFTFQGGREQFHSADSLRAQEKEIVDGARRIGIEPERC